jgi:hypothetical protein
MGTVTIYTIVNAVKNAVDGISGYSATANETLTDGMNDLPMIQVYPETGQTNASGNTDRASFRAGIRRTSLIVNVDVYCRQRAHIGEDMAAIANAADAVQTKLEENLTGAPFDVAGVKTFQWSWQRVMFVYGDPQISYAGIRFELSFSIF